ncbi:MAG: hypothetical protein RL757_1012 [Bacteroidota bacterium]|jgi:hypothetical protein
MKTYIGYDANDCQMPYAQFFDEKILPIQEQVVLGLKHSPMPKGALTDLKDIAQLQKEGYLAVENGYTLEKDGSIQVAVLTEMPNVKPLMWHWWFGWHGSEANRYKIWHPKAHKDARWKDNLKTESYIGRTSQIEEYIGTSLEKANIQFIEPTALGFDSRIVENKNQQVFICARLGYRDYPIDFGWLVHHVRETSNGAEMRSRFFVGGKHIQIRGEKSRFILGGVSKILQQVIKLPEQRAIDLLTHCAEEMNHLAARLPQLYSTFH